MKMSIKEFCNQYTSMREVFTQILGVCYGAHHIC